MIKLFCDRCEKEIINLPIGVDIKDIATVVLRFDYDEPRPIILCEACKYVLKVWLNKDNDLRD